MAQQQHHPPPPPYSPLHLLTTPSSSDCDYSPRLASPSILHTPHPSLPSPLLPSSPAPCPPYLFHLAQADIRRSRPGFISREPSLPSIMSIPSTRPVSPEHLTTSPRTSFAPNRISASINLSNPPSSFSNPTSPHVSHRFFRPSARGLSNLCMFEQGLQHYERLRTPSLRGHSRRTSLIHPSLPDNQSMLKDQLLSNRMFELDLSDDFAEQTLRQPHWSDNEDGEEEEEEDDDDDDDDEPDDHDPFRCDREFRSRGTRKIFKVGDRVGVGTIHQGYRVRDIFGAAPASSPRLSQSSIENYDGSGILEIVRQIGVGS